MAWTALLEAMADWDEEFARFAAEIESVERQTKQGDEGEKEEEKTNHAKGVAVVAPPQRRPTTRVAPPVRPKPTPPAPPPAPPAPPAVPHEPVAPAPVVGAAVRRAAGGETWVDPSLVSWPTNDARLFVGNLGKEVTDEMLAQAFQKYSSFLAAKVVMDKQNHVTKGYGFVSFSDPADLAKALREMNNRFVGTRPVKLKKSNWQERTIGKLDDVEGSAAVKHKPQHKRKHLFSKHFKPY